MTYDDPCSKEFRDKLLELKTDIIRCIDKSHVVWMEALQDFLNSPHEVRIKVLAGLPDHNKKDFLSAICMLANLGLGEAMRTREQNKLAKLN